MRHAIVATLFLLSYSASAEIFVHGTLRAMFHEAQVGSMVMLDEIANGPELYAVGALADLAGEITIVGGEIFLARPDEEGGSRIEHTQESDAGATLLVTARVSGWKSTTVDRAIGFDALDDEIARLAAANGLDLTERFAFVLEGDFEELAWHVIDGRRLKDGGDSHEDHVAAAVNERRDRATGRLVGFYSRNDQGVFTHMGSTTHVHCVIDEPLATGHVDHVVIPSGTKISFSAE